MLVHHLVTMGLLLSSYHADHVPEGTVILFIHNVPDIFTSTSKCLHAMNAKYPTFISYLVMQTAWVYFRLYLLSRFAYSVVTRPSTPSMWYAGFGLWLLEGLHIYWFYLFCLMGKSFLKKGTLPKDSSKKDLVQSEDKLKTDTKKAR